MVDLEGKTVIPGIVEISGSPIVFAKTGNGDISLSEEEMLAKDLAQVTGPYSERGIVAVAEMGTNLSGFASDNMDVFACYSQAEKYGFDQWVSVYYPWAAVNGENNPIADRARLIRDRKVHVAGINIKKTDMLTEEELDRAINYCKDNYCQLSIDSDAEEVVDLMRIKAQTEEDWLMDVGVPPVRIRYTMRSENPFENIKLMVADLVNQGVDQRLATEQAVRLYTKDAAELAGLSRVGEIKQGGSACFVILSDDIFSVSVDEIGNIRPEATYIDGRCVYGTA